MDTTKEFHIGDILSVTTGRLLSKDGIDGVFELMNFLAGANGTSTIGLLTSKDYATDDLFSQFPQLKDVHVPGSVTGRAAVYAFLAEMEEKFGAMHTVKRGGTYHKSPGMESDLETLESINPDAKVFTVIVSK